MTIANVLALMVNQNTGQAKQIYVYVTEQAHDLTILLTFLRMLVRPLMTRENLYLEMLIKHSLLCSVLTLV